MLNEKVAPSAGTSRSVKEFLPPLTRIWSSPPTSRGRGTGRLRQPTEKQRW